MHLDTLLEAVTDTVYHFTNLKTASKILKDGAFVLKPISSTKGEREISSNKRYYFSVTRSRLGQFHSNRDSGVLFTLDGRKLSQRYKSKATDYFQGSSIDEMEDRIITNSPTISTDYIRKIEVLLENPNSPDITAIQNIMKYAERENVPLVVYKTLKALQSRNHKEIYSASEIENMLDGVEDSGESATGGNSVISDLADVINANIKTDSARELKELIMKEPREASERIHDAIEQMTPDETKDFEKVQQFMDKNNLRDIEDLLGLLGYIL